MLSSFKFKNSIGNSLRALIATAVVVPTLGSAQNDSDIEEVVVTGSFIRNSAFTSEANVATITQEDLSQSGAPTIAEYIKNMTFTQNTNTVRAIDVAGSMGSNSGRGASINLRGLGEGSTLQLLDGVRNLNGAISEQIPTLAISQMEVVLDGGSALYGSDAVAGVVNVVPLKEFDGFRASTNFQRDQEQSFERSRASLLWGRSFSDGLNYVGAFDWTKNTPLLYNERPRELEYGRQVSVTANPGRWASVTGVDPDFPLGGAHGGTLGATIRDPNCGTFSSGGPGKPYGLQSGAPASSNRCTWQFGDVFSILDEQENFVVYNSLDWNVSDRLNITLSHNWLERTVQLETSTTTGQRYNNQNAMFVPADHPGNPFGIDVSPHAWRPVASYMSVPASEISWIRHDFGSLNLEEKTKNYRLLLKGEYEISDTWFAHGYYSSGVHTISEQRPRIGFRRMQAALRGEGGASGDQWFNPFGSASPLSPNYIEGVTNNTAEMYEWLIIPDTNDRPRKINRSSLDIFEVGASGDLFDLPAGTVRTAFGYQNRDREFDTFQRASRGSVDEHWYNDPIAGSAVPEDESFSQQVDAVYLELEIPILETVDAQIAARHEEFDNALEATVPKVALRWEALPNLALRASWGESFLAPSLTSISDAAPSCFENFNNVTDPFTGEGILGALNCVSGNPSLEPEQAEIYNFGFTWQGEGFLDGLELSLDYQEIEYTDRIRNISTNDAMKAEFNRFLTETGLDESTYDPAVGSASRSQAEAWFSTRSNSPIVRGSDFEVDEIYTRDENVSSIWINLFDLKTSYQFDIDNIGSFTASLDATYYSKYEYIGLGDISATDATGKQNEPTGLVPPLPNVKASTRLSWARGNHSANLSANFWSDVKADYIPVRDYLNIGMADLYKDEIPSETMINVRYAYDFDDLFGTETRLSFGINNLANKKPERLGGKALGFAYRLSNVYYREFWASFDVTF
jgi:outer membrane receptor protein involved in Fe transport